MLNYKLACQGSKVPVISLSRCAHCASQFLFKHANITELSDGNWLGSGAVVKHPSEFFEMRTLASRRCHTIYTF